MEATIYFYVLTDYRGNKNWVVVKEYGDSVCIGGYGKDDRYQQFESETWHIYEWASQHGMLVECVGQTVTI